MDDFNLKNTIHLCGFECNETEKFMGVVDPYVILDFTQYINQNTYMSICFVLHFN